KPGVGVQPAIPSVSAAVRLFEGAIGDGVDVGTGAGFGCGGGASLTAAIDTRRWSIRNPRCANSALSTLRTVCLAGTSDVVRMCTSWIDPSPLSTTRTE